MIDSVVLSTAANPQRVQSQLANLDAMNEELRQAIATAQLAAKRAFDAGNGEAVATAFARLQQLEAQLASISQQRASFEQAVQAHYAPMVDEWVLSTTVAVQVAADNLSLQVAALGALIDQVEAAALVLANVRPAHDQRMAQASERLQRLTEVAAPVALNVPYPDMHLPPIPGGAIARRLTDLAAQLERLA